MANGDQCIVTCSDGLRNLFFRSNGIYGGGICSTGRVRAERGENRIEIDAREGAPPPSQITFLSTYLT